MTATQEQMNEIAKLANKSVADGVAICDCGLLEAVYRLFHWPFQKPIVWSFETNELSTKGYAVKLMHETPGGRISTKNMATLFFEYCPFCGARINEDKLKE